MTYRNLSGPHRDSHEPGGYDEVRTIADSAVLRSIIEALTLRVAELEALVQDSGIAIMSSESATMHMITKIQLRRSDKQLVITYV